MAIKNVYDELWQICQEFKSKTNLKTNYIEYISALIYIYYVKEQNNLFLQLYEERNNYYIAELVDRQLEEIRKIINDNKIFTNLNFRNLIIHRGIGENSVLSFVILKLNNLFNDETIKKIMVANAYQEILEKVISLGEFVIDNREFYTPNSITNLVAKLVLSKNNETIYDPCCGSGNFLISAYNENKKVYGEERNISYYNICKTNLLLNDIDSSNIKLNEYINNKIISDMKYDIVLSNPPFSDKDYIKNLDDEGEYLLYKYNLKSTSYGDYAILLKMLDSLNYNGKMAIILPHGVLFRNSEREVRKELVENGYIKAIIGLPENLFFDNRLSVIIMVLSKEKSQENILFIDASQEYLNLRKTYKIPDMSIKKIVTTYKNKKEENGFSHIATKEEIRTNEYNLTIKKYIKKEIKLKSIDKNEILKNISSLEKEKEILEEHIKDVLEVLGRKDIVNVKVKENEEEDQNKNYDFDYTVLGKNISKIRILKKYTIEQLAEKLDVSYRYLTRVEMGIATPRMETLVKICKVLGVQMNDLFINHDIR